MRTLILSLLCYLGLGTGMLQAQNLKAYEKAGDAAFAKQEYYTALYYYEVVVQKKKKPALYYKYAQAARLAYAYQKAEDAYRKVAESPEKVMFPDLDFHYATSLKHNARYEEAALMFERFVQERIADDALKAKARQEILACRFAQEMVKQNNVQAQIQRLNDKVNTDYSDFAPLLVDSFFYYSSLSFEKTPDPKEKKNKKDKTAKEDASKRMVSKLIRSTNDSTKGYPLPVVNAADLHNANATVSHDGQRMYFTRCQAQRSDSLRCEVYLSRRQANGEWGNPRKLPAPVNLDGCPCTNTHPSLSYDPATGREWLFWSSDRSGGQGGLDIWQVELFNAGGNFGPAKNLGTSINTPEDDATPFFHQNSRTLYFASQWHNGLGGYDLFKAEYLADSTWGTAQNLGLPFNSAANDLFYYRRGNDSIGYFASNRSGSLTIAGESCCNDLYKFVLPTEQPPVIAQNDPPKKDEPKKVEPPVTIAQNDPPKKDEPKKVEPPVTIAQNDPPKKDEPKKVEPPVTITQNDPPKTTVLPPVEPKPVQPDPLKPNEELISTKMNELNAMLPLSLYFHNDEPDSNSRATTTLKPYDLPYYHYLSLEDEYIREHSRQFKVEMQGLARQRVKDFFENEVKGEYNRMNQFFEKILELLDQGVKLEIHIKGYTSPRSNEGYNQALAQRRITSVRKQLFIYKGGIFMKHFQKGNFSVKEVPLGESTVPRGVNDRMDDPQNSIYSVEASKERRAEIIVIKRN